MIIILNDHAADDDDDVYNNLQSPKGKKNASPKFCLVSFGCEQRVIVLRFSNTELEVKK